MELRRSFRSFSSGAGQKPRCTILQLEVLEERSCPSGTWEWNCPVGGDGKWSNPRGGNWLHNGIAAPAGQYPGMAGSMSDDVTFDLSTPGPATVDVAAVNPLNSLKLTGWGDTLTLNWGLTVNSGYGGFTLSDGSTITMAANTDLLLLDLGPPTGMSNQWSNGTITGGANSHLYVTGTDLFVIGAAFPGNQAFLGTNLVIQQDISSIAGKVTLINMSGNLTLSGTSNYIDVGNGGTLALGQQVAAGQQNKVGGIDAPGRTAAMAVQVENGGTLSRSSAALPGVPDQVMIAGPVYNLGGTLEVVMNGAMLNITGKDTNGYSYWQKSSASDLLYLHSATNISAVGTYQIDTGTVTLTASSGGSADELDGAGLNFGNASTTALTFVDATAGTPGTVTVQGPVTLGQNTTTTLNFSGATNTADLLDVHNGALTLNGKLSLQSSDRKKPTSPLNFLDDSGTTPSIAGNFTSITDNVSGTDTGAVVPKNPTLVYYQVTIS